jgi:hypothetical protein
MERESEVLISGVTERSLRRLEKMKGIGGFTQAEKNPR